MKRNARKNSFSLGEAVSHSNANFSEFVCVVLGTAQKDAFCLPFA